ETPVTLRPASRFNHFDEIERNEFAAGEIEVGRRRGNGRSIDHTWARAYSPPNSAPLSATACMKSYLEKSVAFSWHVQRLNAAAALHHPQTVSVTGSDRERPRIPYI
ncbi:MAG: hypothetical protein Q9192_002353, partial [Flavoplaca navasiana]